MRQCVNALVCPPRLSRKCDHAKPHESSAMCHDKTYDLCGNCRTIIGERLKPLQLFVFEDFNPDYTDGLAFAIAASADEAKAMIRKHRHNVYGCDVEPVWGKMKVFAVDKRVARAVSGGA